MNPYSPNQNQDEEPDTPINYDVEITIGMSFIAGILLGICLVIFLNL